MKIPHELKVSFVDAILKKKFNCSYIYGGYYRYSFNELFEMAQKELTSKQKRKIVDDICKILMFNDYWQTKEYKEQSIPITDEYKLQWFNNNVEWIRKV